jgi:enamine deaminase RidA (YjgF/YER057c/UK114 family)
MAKRRSVIPDGMQDFYDQFHFSPAVRVGKTVYASGQVGAGPEGKLDPDPAVQISQAFENVRAVLERAGSGLEDVVEMTTFHVGFQEHIGIFMQVKDAFLKEPYPAWTAIGVSELAFGALVEIKVTARRGSGKKK